MQRAIATAYRRVSTVAIHVCVVDLGVAVYLGDWRLAEVLSAVTAFFILALNAALRREVEALYRDDHPEERHPQ